MNLIFNQAFPDTFRSQVVGMIRHYELLLPAWVQEVFVYWSDEDGNFASMNVHTEYGRVDLYVNRAVVEMPYDFQRGAVLHEILHCFNAPVGNVAFEIRDMMFPKGDESENNTVKLLYNMITDRIRETTERVNSDLTFAITRFEKALASDNEIAQ